MHNTGVPVVAGGKAVGKPQQQQQPAPLQPTVATTTTTNAPLARRSESTTTTTTTTATVVSGKSLSVHVPIVAAREEAVELELELELENGPCNMSLDESQANALDIDDGEDEEEEAFHQEGEVIGLESEVDLEDDVGVDNQERGPNVEDIDDCDKEDPQCVAEYAGDIYRHLRRKERRYALDAQYMRRCQPDLNTGMRAILLDWLADVGLKFKLLNDTTHMTTMLVDRFLSVRHNVSRTQLQLVGVACMLIASKYEEIYAPEVGDFEYICDGAFTRQQILDMEVTVLQALQYEICHPTPIHFLRRFSKAARSDSECHTLAKYLTELAAIRSESLQFTPSMLAAASVFLSRQMHIQPDESFTWNATMVHYTGYTKQSIRQCVTTLAQWAREAQNPQAKLTAVYRKYSKRFFGVACFPVPSNAVLEAELADM